jgi:hypothetical protein
MTFSLLEYIKIHRISLEQDWQELNAKIDPLESHWQLRDLANQIKVLDHLIYVAEETE